MFVALNEIVRSTRFHNDVKGNEVFFLREAVVLIVSLRKAICCTRTLVVSRRNDRCSDPLSRRRTDFQGFLEGGSGKKHGAGSVSFPCRVGSFGRL